MCQFHRTTAGRSFAGLIFFRRLSGWLLATAMPGIIALASAATALAEPPQVQFDVGPIVACRDVTPPEFAELHPDERLIELPLAISSLIQSGDESDLLEYLYLIDSPSRGMHVEDYLPKTTLATDVVGSIGVERHEDASRTLGLNVAGEVTSHVKTTATGSTSASRSEKVLYERMPPLELLSASGTMQRSTAAYFKLKPSPRTSLEGAKQFVLVLRVPAAWRGDYVRVRCDAQGYNRGMVHRFDEQMHCGRAEFYLAMYAEGDLAAKKIAGDFVASEQRLRQSVDAHRRSIQASRYPTKISRVGGFLSLVEPQIPDGWFDDILRSPGHEAIQRYARHLPESVRQAALQYQTAKDKLQTLNGRSL